MGQYMHASPLSSSVWPAMTTLKLPAFVWTVLSTSVPPVWMPTKEWNLPKTTPSERRRTYHKVFVVWSSVVKNDNAKTFPLRIANNTEVQMMSFLLFSRGPWCVDSEANVLWYPQTRAAETVLWDLRCANLSWLPTSQAQGSQVLSNLQYTIISQKGSHTCVQILVLFYCIF